MDDNGWMIILGLFASLMMGIAIALSNIWILTIPAAGLSGMFFYLLLDMQKKSRNELIKRIEKLEKKQSD
jgi:preprotein translocase subunit YajC